MRLSRLVVLDNAFDGNNVVALDRRPDGTLRQAATYATDGIGGRLDGATADNTASRGSLVLDRHNSRLSAVNAGSNTVSIFDVSDGRRLRLAQVLPGGGVFPISVAVRGEQLFVLNARAGASIQGFVRKDGDFAAIPGSHHELELPSGSPEFTHTPGQVTVSPDGSHLIVTTKAAEHSIRVYALADTGELAQTPVISRLEGGVPFGMTYDHQGHLVVADAGLNGVRAYTLADDGTLTQSSSVTTGQLATCWVTASSSLLAASNATSSTVTVRTSGQMRWRPRRRSVSAASSRPARRPRRLGLRTLNACAS